MCAQQYNKEDWAFSKLIQATPVGGASNPNLIPNILNTNITSSIIYGHAYTPSINKKAVDYLRNNFITQPNDIIITSYPRCGTHWLMKICFEIIKNCSKNANNLPPEYKNTDIRFIPLIESMVSKNNGINILKTFRNRYNNKYNIFNTYWSHAPFYLFPAKQINKHSKIIHIIRDPKDVIVSMFHFFNAVAKNNNINNTTIKLNDLIKLFNIGFVSGGNYWSSYLSWWYEYKKNNFNILWLFYEDIKKNPMKEFKRIGEFLCNGYGSNYLDVKIFRKTEVLNQIISNCSFQSQKKEAKRGYKILYRKGIIGEWKSVLSNEQIKMIDNITKIRFHCERDNMYYNNALHSKL